MHVVFATSESVDAVYRSELGIAAAFALLVALTVLSVGLRSQVLAWRSSLAVGLGLFFICGAVVRHTRESRFLALDATPGQIALSFVGDQGLVTIPRDQIAEVLFGYDGKYSPSCHIAVVDKGGERYQSALLANHHDPCKEYRRRIVQLLGI